MRFLLAVLLLGSVARADEHTKLEAKKLRDEAVEQWERGEYLPALEGFQKAYALFPSPNLQFNIARVLTDLGRDVEAIEAFERFLEHAADAPADAVSVAKAKLAVLSEKIARIDVHCQAADAELLLDGKSLGKSPIDRVVRVAPGAHQIAGELPGHLPYLKPVSLLPNQEERIEVTFKKLGADKKPLKKQWWFWTALGGVAAVAATSVALGVVYGTKDPHADIFSMPSKANP